MRYRRFLNLSLMRKLSLSLYLYLLIIVSCAVSERKESFTPDALKASPDASFAIQVAGEKVVEVKSVLSDGIE